MVKKGVWLLLIMLLLSTGIATAETIKLEPIICGETNLYEQGNGGNAEWVMENDCIKVEMRQNNYDTNTEIYDKINDRNFRLMANQIEERNNAGPGTSTTTLTSLNLDSDIDEEYIRWTDNQGISFGYSLTGRTFKIVANLTDWNYNYADSDLWLDMRFHKNEGDTLLWIPVIVDGVEQPIITEERTAGQNTFIAQKLGRGYEIIIDPLFVVDYSPIPGLQLINGTNNESADSEYDEQNDITTILSDDDIYTARTTKTIYEPTLTKDAYTYQGSPNSNYGSSVTLIAGTIGINHFNAHLEFDLSDMPTGTIQKATLRLFDYWGATATNTTIHQVTQEWHENNLTWNNKPNYNNTPDTTHYLVTSPNDYIEIDVKSLVQKWQDGTNNYGLVMNNITSGAYHYFRSKEYGTNPPRLIVEVEDSGTSFSTHWNKTYNPSFDYFVRLYKLNAGTSTATAQAYDDTDNISTLTTTKELTGIGWYNINVTSIMDYETNNQSLPFTQIRLYADTESLISEVRLRIEGNDTESPTIHSVTVNDTNIGCYETSLITVNATDNLDVDLVNITLNNGTANNTIELVQNYPLWEYTLNPLIEANITYNITDATACDILGQCNSTTPGNTINYYCDICVENWQLTYDDMTSCRTNNTILQRKHYIDQNSCGTNDTLPGDNNTIVENYCNYCDPDWQPINNPCLNNNTQYIEYVDNNYCYAITNLTEDSPPIDHETWQPCNYLDKEFTCYHSQSPYISGRIDYQCVLPETQEWKCTNRLNHFEGDLLQVNPQKTERTQGGLIQINKIEESREYFTANNGLLNAYYTNKNVVVQNQFIITTTCNSVNETLVHQELITPIIKDLNKTPSWLLWGKENATYIVVLLLLLIIASLILGSLWKNAKG